MSSFAKEVYDVVKKIPKGSVLSYKEVAILANRPQAARAVATVMANNFDPNVPCHRVIKSDGTIGGYNRGGEEVKRCILESEGYTTL